MKRQRLKIQRRTPLEKMRARVEMVRYLRVLAQSEERGQENCSTGNSGYLKSVIVREEATRSTRMSNPMKNNQGNPAWLCKEKWMMGRLVKEVPTYLLVNTL